MTRNATVQYTKNLQLNDLNTKQAVKIIVTEKNSRFESSSFNRYCTLNNITKGQEIMLLKGLRHPNLRRRLNSTPVSNVCEARSQRLPKASQSFACLISEDKLFHRTALLQALISHNWSGIDRPISRLSLPILSIARSRLRDSRVR